jgi:type I restriction enzyme S subunit
VNRSGALRYFATIKNGTTPASGEPSYWDGDVAWATPDDLGRLTGSYIVETKRMVTQLAVAENNLNLVPVDTVLMSTRAPIGHIAIAARPLTFNQGCRALIPYANTWGPYLLYLLKSRVPELNASANGTTFVELSRDELAAVRITLPTLEAQKRIAAFLDEKTAQIDALIARKQALLARLSEKRQAIITQAVTKGLNPAAPMKESGINWLGQIPEHWDVKRLNSFCGFQSGKAHEPFIDPEGEYVCVNARFISTDGVTEKRCTENLCPTVPGDILMVMSDLPNGRALARTFLVDDRDAYAVNQRVCRIRLQRGEPRYFSYQLNRHPQLMSHDDGNEQTHLPNVAFKQILLLEPSLQEQENIADYLDDQRTRLDAIVAKAGESVAGLQEYRSALITSAVIGQIESLR